MTYRCAKPFCTSGWCATFSRCLFDGRPFECAGGCEITWPHYHEQRTAPSGNVVQTVVYIPEDEHAEVRDPDTGEVIFPARRTKLRLVPNSTAALSTHKGEG